MKEAQAERRARYDVKRGETITGCYFTLHIYVFFNILYYNTILYYRIEFDELFITIGNLYRAPITANG